MRVFLLPVLCLTAMTTWPVWACAADEDEPDAPAPRGEPTAVVHAKVKAEAAQQYRKLTAAYLNGNWSEVKDILAGSSKWIYGLTPQQGADLQYVRANYQEYRPSWWKSCRSESNISFPARIWNRQFTANYVPSELLGAQGAVGIKNNKIQIVVTWRPSLLDSTVPLAGQLAVRHGLTEAHLGEVVVWHELGHNYVTNFLPLDQVMQLYMNYMPLFTNLQEFYADMTSLHHCSPKGRLACLMLRLEAIDPSPPTSSPRGPGMPSIAPAATQRRMEADPHSRATQAIGSFLLNHFLAEPQKWPSIHFPPKVPQSDVERRTILYVYENIDTGWTIAEDRNLRELIRRFMTQSGESVLRKKGLLILPRPLGPLSGGQSFQLMSSEDQEFRQKRDAWTAEQLEKLIAAGRADKHPPPPRLPGEQGRVVVPK